MQRHSGNLRLSTMLTITVLALQAPALLLGDGMLTPSRTHTPSQIHHGSEKPKYKGSLGERSQEAIKTAARSRRQPTRRPRGGNGRSPGRGQIAQAPGQSWPEPF